MVIVQLTAIYAVNRTLAPPGDRAWRVAARPRVRQTPLALGAIRPRATRRPARAERPPRPPPPGGGGGPAALFRNGANSAHDRVFATSFASSQARRPVITPHRTI